MNDNLLSWEQIESIYLLEDPNAQLTSEVKIKSKKILEELILDDQFREPFKLLSDKEKVAFIVVMVHLAVETVQEGIPNFKPQLLTILTGLILGKNRESCQSN